MKARSEVMDWENFIMRFVEKYFLDNSKFSKEAKFLSLEQGDMLVNAYATRFEYLARFYTQPTSEAYKYRKFEKGLTS